MVQDPESPDLESIKTSDPNVTGASAIMLIRPDAFRTPQPGS